MSQAPTKNYEDGIRTGNDFCVVPHIDPAETTAIADAEVIDGIGDFVVVVASAPI